MIMINSYNYIQNAFLSSHFYYFSCVPCLRRGSLPTNQRREIVLNSGIGKHTTRLINLYQVYLFTAFCLICSIFNQNFHGISFGRIKTCIIRCLQRRRRYCTQLHGPTRAIYCALCTDLAFQFYFPNASEVKMAVSAQRRRQKPEP